MGPSLVTQLCSASQDLEAILLINVVSHRSTISRYIQNPSPRITHSRAVSWLLFQTTKRSRQLQKKEEVIDLSDAIEFMLNVFSNHEAVI